MKTAKDYYGQIDKELRSYEENKPYHELGIDWVCSRIDWCWRFKKITEQQMNELADRAIKVLNNDY